MNVEAIWIVGVAALALTGCNQAQGTVAAKDEVQVASQTVETVALQKEISVGAPIVFFDIAGTDLQKQMAFYKNSFGWDIAPDGRFSVSVTTPLHGFLRTDPSDTLLYMGVDDVTAALTKIEANGGTIDAPRFEVPGVVILGLYRDPAGNRMGLVEIEGGKAKIPKAK